jgi:hypothetical protein
MTGKNVLLPIPLVKRMIALLEEGDVSGCSRDDQRDILQSLVVKMRRIELRGAYAEILAADSEDSRRDARLSYLRQKNRLDDFSDDD